MRLQAQDAADTVRMKPSAALAAVDPVAGVHRLPDDAAAFAAKLAPGTRLRVRVEDELPEGGSRARTLDGEHEVRLPFPAKRGAVLELVLVSRSPQLTFALVRPDGVPAETQLSETARALSDLARMTDANAVPPRAAAPLLEGAPTDTAALVRALQQALALSGLFYESHQAQWLAGLRSREELMREPQARIAARAARDENAPAAADGAHPDLDRVVHRQALPLVQQQLAALESGVVPWRGDMWAGQAMEWEVTRDPQRPARDADAGARWQTRLRLTLPHLGAIAATLVIDAAGVQVRLSAARQAATDLLRAGAPRLADAMHAAGLEVSSIEVRHDGK